MPSTCLVLIASAEQLPALARRVADPNADVLKYPDTETLQALQAITKRLPKVVALERAFAATPRGTALMNRIKADPRLAGCEIRVISPDDEPTEPPRTDGQAAVGTGGAGATSTTPTISATAATAATSLTGASNRPLDWRGTRRASRFKIDGYGGVVVDGKSATLLDLSACGAQIVLTKVLRPNQRVQMTLSDDAGTIRFNATIVWAAFEMPPKGDPRYRVGIEFIDADAEAVEAFCSRHRSSLTPEA